MQRKKWVWAALLAVSLVGGTAYYMVKMGGATAHAQNNAPAQMPPTEVNIVRIAPQPLTVTKDLPGRTSAFRIAEIRPQVSGIITARLFEEGGDIAEGQQLYQIDPAPYQAAYNRAEADLQKAEANVKSVEAKAARYAQLVKIGGVSKQEYDDVSAGLAQAQADVAIARAALATAKINLDYTKVFSPIAGRIGQSHVTEGALVTANQPEALATVQQIDKIYVDVTQSGEELMRLRRHYADRPHEKPSARLVIGDQLYEAPGLLQFSDISVNQTTGTVQLRILFPNEKREILPDLFVHARLEQYSEDNAILVPQKSVMRNPDGSVTVWVIDDEDKAGIRPIEIAEAIGDQWRVVSGLNAGDRVVVEGIMKIAPGAVVKPVEVEQGVDTAHKDAVLESDVTSPPDMTPDDVREISPLEDVTAPAEGGQEAEAAE